MKNSKSLFNNNAFFIKMLAIAIALTFLNVGIWLLLQETVEQEYLLYSLNSLFWVEAFIAISYFLLFLFEIEGIIKTVLGLLTIVGAAYLATSFTWIAYGSWVLLIFVFLVALAIWLWNILATNLSSLIETNTMC